MLEAGLPSTNGWSLAELALEHTMVWWTLWRLSSPCCCLSLQKFSSNDHQLRDVIVKFWCLFPSVLVTLPQDAGYVCSLFSAHILWHPLLPLASLQRYQKACITCNPITTISVAEDEEAFPTLTEKPLFQVWLKPFWVCSVDPNPLFPSSDQQLMIDCVKCHTEI